jgi:hypothetical protein
MKRLPVLVSLCLAFALATDAHAFCGFFVATGDAKLFNHASQVVLVRDGDRTVLTMANDFKGDPREFALVVPVPVVLKRDQIHVGDRAAIDHLDAFTAPRLVEYWDPNPCQTAEREEGLRLMGGVAPSAKMSDAARANALGVKIEARYTVGEYDILILSATQSSGLQRWLTENGYRVPPNAARVLGIYLKQGMKFFVAKVNLKEKANSGFHDLRPLQMAYESSKFMLPIRLGMVNADGPQELFVYALTKTGRVEPTNYRNVKLASDAEIPEYVKDVFPQFYRAMFGEQVRKENLSVVFLEYAWDMSWCDPCASQPLSNDELRKLGVFWVGDASQPNGSGAQNAFVTRLHARYDAAHFPEDLVLQQTSDRTNFQGRFVIRHPWTGDDDCPAVETYRAQLRERREKEARTLASLTGWNLDDIRGRMGVASDWSREEERLTWYQKLWGKSPDGK